MDLEIEIHKLYDLKIKHHWLQYFGRTEVFIFITTNNHI